MEKSIVDKLKQLKNNLNETISLDDKAKALKIGIVGIGSIGTTLAVLLSKNGYDVEITKRNVNALVIDNCVNLEVNGEFGDYSYLVPCVQNNNFTSKKDLIIMCTQSFSTINAIQEIKKYLAPNGYIMTIQNVLNYDDIIEVIPEERYIAMVLDWNVIHSGPNQVNVVKKGDIHIGMSKPNMNMLEIVKKMLGSFTETFIEKDIQSYIINRFILSCSISSIIALTGYRLGTTIEYKEAKEILVGLVAEMVSVFETYGYRVNSYKDKLDYHLFITKGMKGQNYRRKMFKLFKTNNANKGSTLLVALETKKRTELDSMCEKVVELAVAKNIDVPYNKAVAGILRKAEQGEHGITLDNLTLSDFDNLEIKWR